MNPYGFGNELLYMAAIAINRIMIDIGITSTNGILVSEELLELVGVMVGV
tara:strand:- start:17 stop:166 length:150 start_codon:yes stop_codon:yes gene_type:complete